MRPIALDAKSDLNQLSGSVVVLTEDVKAGDVTLRKGRRLTADDLGLVSGLGRSVHAVVLDPGDVHEDEAGGRLAAAVTGPELEIDGPKFSRYNLIARAKGLVRVDPAALLEINRVPGMAVFTLPDRLPVVPGKVVAGVKVTPVAVTESALREAEALAAEAAPVIQVLPFQPLQVGIINTERPEWKVRKKFEEAVERKIRWYGGAVLGFHDVLPDAEAIAARIEDLSAQGADLVLAAGGSTIDPLDPTLLALERAGAGIIRYGAPADPGSMFWLAYRGEMPIFNLASCSMFSRTTVADLVLPWIMTGERIVPDTLAELGHGGLLEREMAYRFPTYEIDRIDET